MTEQAAVVQEISEEEAAAVFGEKKPEDEGAAEGDVEEQAAGDTNARTMMDEHLAAAPSEEGFPDWFTPPANFKPPIGQRLGFMRFKANWTAAPHKGERQIVMWGLTEVEERLAYARARGDGLRSIAELAKASIRYIDGRKVDWTGKGAGANANEFWTELGTACRQLVQNYYLKANALSREEMQDFFMNCFAVRSAVAG